MSWIKGLGAVVALLAVVAVALVAIGAWRWNAATRALHERLDAARQPPAVTRFDPRELDGLPPPVQRYLRAALTPGQSVVTAAHIEHTGTFNLGDGAERWAAFTSTQRVTTQRPGFVWDARIAMAPGLAVRVHDAYVVGEGLLHPALLGLFTLIELRGGGDVAQGELMRWFAETAWYPTALLPSQGVRWSPIDDRSARATFADGALVLTLTFRFGADDTIESVRAEARGRTVGHDIVMTPWEGRWSDVQTRDGMRVPTRGEVAWLLHDGTGGRLPYWRGTVTSLRYEFAP